MVSGEASELDSPTAQFSGGLCVSAGQRDLRFRIDYVCESRVVLHSLKLTVRGCAMAASFSQVTEAHEDERKLVFNRSEFNDRISRAIQGEALKAGPNCGLHVTDSAISQRQ